MKSLFVVIPSFFLLFNVLVAGSYVALTVLGRPPGLPQISLDEEKEQQQPEEEEEEESDTPPFFSAPNSPVLSGEERSSFLSSSSPQNHLTCSPTDGVRQKY